LKGDSNTRYFHGVAKGRVSDEENAHRTAAYPKDEVKKGCFQTGVEQIPRTGWFPSIVILNFSEIIKWDLMALFSALHEG
jgi:hypothetical protein